MEQQWAENRLTAEGRLLHQRADLPGSSYRKGVRTVTAMPLSDHNLALIGVADVVEFHSTQQGEQAFPVEYKRGRPKDHQADEVQLCAQALCLEVMLNQTIAQGALYYGQTHRRKEVLFDHSLRELTLQTIQQTHTMLESGQTPQAEYQAKKCSQCSLFDICQPQWFKQPQVMPWLQAQLRA